MASVGYRFLLQSRQRRAPGPPRPQLKYLKNYCARPRPYTRPEWCDEIGQPYGRERILGVRGNTAQDYQDLTDRTSGTSSVGRRSRRSLNDAIWDNLQVLPLMVHSQPLLDQPSPFILPLAGLPLPPPLPAVSPGPVNEQSQPQPSAYSLGRNLTAPGSAADGQAAPTSPQLSYDSDSAGQDHHSDSTWVHSPFPALGAQLVRQGTPQTPQSLLDSSDAMQQEASDPAPVPFLTFPDDLDFPLPSTPPHNGSGIASSSGIPALECGQSGPVSGSSSSSSDDFLPPLPTYSPASSAAVAAEPGSGSSAPLGHLNSARPLFAAVGSSGTAEQNTNRKGGSPKKAPPPLRDFLQGTGSAMIQVNTAQVDMSQQPEGSPRIDAVQVAYTVTRQRCAEVTECSNHAGRQTDRLPVTPAVGDVLLTSHKDARLVVSKALTADTVKACNQQLEHVLSRQRVQHAPLRVQDGGLWYATTPCATATHYVHQQLAHDDPFRSAPLSVACCGGSSAKERTGFGSCNSSRSLLLRNLRTRWRRCQTRTSSSCLASCSTSGSGQPSLTDMQ